MVGIVSANKSSSLGLMSAFEASDKTPVKSSFSERRQTVSYKFFEEIFEFDVAGFSDELPTWKGLRVVATDGDNYSLPATGDALELGYRGAAVKEGRETYYPRMYVSTLYDVLSGRVLSFEESSQNNELERAMKLQDSLPDSKTLVLYDRFYFSKKLVTEHLACGSYFLCRLKNGDRVLGAVKSFLDSGRRNQTVDIEGLEVHLIRVRNPKTGEDSYFATNMQRPKFRNKEVLELYARRWDIETSFRDLTETMNLESWHSKSVNGIKQEIFVVLWTYNQTKTMEFEQNPRSWFKKLDRVYERPCFKAILIWFAEHFIELCNTLSEKAWRQFKMIIERTMEKRVRLSRSYPRASKQPAAKHSSDALVPRRA
jgi:hypothetical protein